MPGCHTYHKRTAGAARPGHAIARSRASYRYTTIAQREEVIETKALVR